MFELVEQGFFNRTDTEYAPQKTPGFQAQLTDFVDGLQILLTVAYIANGLGMSLADNLRLLRVQPCNVTHACDRNGAGTG